MYAPLPVAGVAENGDTCRVSTGHLPDPHEVTAPVCEAIGAEAAR
jgi:hypothetical protein